MEERRGQYKRYTLNGYDLARHDNGQWWYRGLNICQNPEGRKWLGPFRSEQAVCLAISHSMRSKLVERVQASL